MKAPGQQCLMMMFDGSFDGSDTMGFGPLVPTESERSLMECVRQELKHELQQGYKEKLVDNREEILRKRRAGKLPGDTTSVLKAWCEVRVRFIGFGSEEDEWVNVKKAIREHSLPLEHSKCGKLEVGDLIVAVTLALLIGLLLLDQRQSTLLDWSKCFYIINGIAQGLLYLHQDSRMRIIHINLKASNILLDIDMNLKISDFGIASSFGGNEIEANTNRVIGTYGYMSPEYAIDGLFLVKSDIFSFDVLVLEIVSGKKNKGFYHSGHRLNLFGHSWRLYKEGKSLELIDEALWDSCDQIETFRSIHVGLLCVQESPEDRPSMSSIVLMLGDEAALPQAKQLGLFTARNVLQPGSSSSKEATTTGNEITITLLSAR
ncbi:unnamed protein product [Camellia sinensis]